MAPNWRGHKTWCGSLSVLSIVALSRCRQVTWGDYLRIFSPKRLLRRKGVWIRRESNPHLHFDREQCYTFLFGRLLFSVRVDTIMTEAAPPIALFDGWEARTSISFRLRHCNACSGVQCHPPFEPREGWGSLFCGNTSRKTQSWASPRTTLRDFPLSDLIQQPTHQEASVQESIACGAHRC